MTPRLRIPRYAAHLVLGCAIGAPLATAAGQSASGSAFAITNVNLLPMDRDVVLRGQTVVVERGIITRVSDARNATIPAGAQRIDGTGKYLMPGLIDVHVHLASNPEAEQPMLLKLFVANGVTTVLNMRGNAQMLQLRAAVASGRVLGPAIYTVGPFVNEPFVKTPDDVERAVVDQARAGYDFVKLHGDLSREAYARLMVVARREGLRVVGHAPRNLGLDVMFDEGQYAVAHAEEFIYDRNNSSRDFALIEPRIPELARAMARKHIWLTANLTAYKMIGWMANDLPAVLARPEIKFLPLGSQQGWGPATNPYTARFGKESYPGFMARFALLQKLVRGFQSGGVRILVGTDAMNPGVVPGFSTHDELAELVTAGLTPFQALRAATASGAEFLAAGDQRGVVAVGQRADLLLLEANPLESITNSRRIAGVMLRDRWFARADIDAMLGSLVQP